MDTVDRIQLLLAFWPEDDNTFNNALPPVSEEEMREIEDLLGVAFPPLLRRVYTEVANGGIGPGDGLLPLPGYGSWSLFQVNRYYDDLLMVYDSGCTMQYYVLLRPPEYPHRLTGRYGADSGGLYGLGGVPRASRHGADLCPTRR